MTSSVRVALAVVSLVACGGQSGERLREHTYPPSFEYIDQTRLKSAMWTLAQEMKTLEQDLSDPATDAAQQQRAVGEVLARVEATVDSIAKPGQVTQHPLLNQNLPHFRERVRRARADVAHDPPNYFTASELAGSCAACHDSGPAEWSRPHVKS